MEPTATAVATLQAVAESASVWPQWVIDLGVVFGIVAFIVGLISLPQIIWGGARLLITSGTSDNPTRYLDVVLTNPVVRSRVARVLHVQRAAIEEAVVHLTIIDDRSGDVVGESVPRIKTDSNITSQRARIPSSVFGATV